MQINEPTTALTDYVLGAAALVLAVRLLAAARPRETRAGMIWAAGFTAAGLAAIAGGTYHGFSHYLGTAMTAAMWKVTVLLMGAGSLCMLLAVIVISVRRPYSGWAAALACLKFGVYAAWVAHQDDFLFAALDYVASLLVVLFMMILLIPGHAKMRLAAIWIAAGVIVSLGGVAVQASGYDIHRHFNHNDVFHVIQLGGVFCFYAGARLFP